MPVVFIANSIISKEIVVVDVVVYADFISIATAKLYNEWQESEG